MQAKPNLSENTRIVQHFRRAIDFCTLGHVPQTTRELLATEAWRERFEMGRRIQFNGVTEFITAPTSQGGCGWRPDKVTELLHKSGDSEALRMWLAAIKAKEIEAKAPDLLPVGRPTKPRDKKDVTRFSDDASYAIARLRRDRPDIHQRVLAGELSPHAGMIEAGFRKKRPSKKLTMLQRILKMFESLSESEGDELIERLIRERKKPVLSKNQLAMFQ